MSTKIIRYSTSETQYSHSAQTQENNDKRFMLNKHNIFAVRVRFGAVRVKSIEIFFIYAII